MTDEDVYKIVVKLSETLATKEDIKDVKVDLKRLENKIDEVNINLGNKIDEVDKKLSKKIDELDSKSDTLLQYANGIDDTTSDHEKRLKKIEAIPVIAHELKSTPN